MAEKGKTNDIERVYRINLRRAWLNHPRSRRTKKSISAIREFVLRHTKSADVKISGGINEYVMSRGFKKPPGKISIEVSGDFASVQAKLPGEVITKREVKKSGMGGLKERLMTKRGVTPKKKEEIEEKAKEATSDEKIKEATERVAKEEKTEKPSGKLAEKGKKDTKKKKPEKPPGKKKQKKPETKKASKKPKNQDKSSKQGKK